MKRSPVAIDKEKQNRIAGLFNRVVGLFSEFILTQTAGPKNSQNVFGRPVHFEQDATLARIQGMAATGMRCAALLHASDLKSELSTLKAMVRQHCPVTLLILGNKGEAVADIATSGAIIFQAHSAQSMADRLLMAPVIAEKCLLPVVIMASAFEEGAVDLPEAKPLLNFLGDPDDFTNPKSATQEMLLGKKRKRMPGWYSIDLPVAMGVDKQSRARAMESAAEQVFFRENIQSWIDETQKDFQTLTGKTYEGWSWAGAEKSKHLIISNLPLSSSAIERISQKTFQREGLKLISLEQLQPLPDLKPLTDKKTSGICVLAWGFQSANIQWLFKEISAVLPLPSLYWQKGNCEGPLGDEHWEALFENCLKGEKGKQNFWLDVPFQVEQSQFPKHQIRLQQMAKANVGLNEKSLYTGQGTLAAPLQANRAPLIQLYKDKGPAYSRLSRFYDDILCFYGQPQSEEVADPFQALPLMPPASAHFLQAQRNEIPVFDPKKCQRPDAFLASCPYGAISAALLNIDEVLKGGMQQASKRKESIGQLTPYLKLLLQKAGEQALRQSENIIGIDDFLPQAFSEVLGQIQVDEEKSAQLKSDFEAMTRGLTDLPLAVTQSLFCEREKRESGSGELFTLSFNPSSCNGCGICAAACDDHSIRMEKATEALEINMAKAFAATTALPDTSGDSINRMIEDPSFDPFAALILSKYLNSGLSGAAEHDEYAAEKTIIRLFSATAEQILQPALIQLDETLGKQLLALQALVKKTLADALPLAHLDALMEILENKEERHLGLDEVVKDWGQHEAFKRIDKIKLQRWLFLIDALKEWRWSIKEGMTGAGKVRYGVVLDTSLSWAATHPWNHFSVPVLLAESGCCSETALGLFQGQMRHSLDQIKLLRRATLEAAQKYDPSIHDLQIAGLQWSHLSEEEKSWVAPIFVVGDSEMLVREGMPSVCLALDSDFPIKYLLLDYAAPSAPSAASDIPTRENAFWPLLTLENTFIARASLHDRRDLFQAFVRALKNSGGALVSVLCPQAFAHSSAPENWSSLSTLAVNTRAFNPIQFHSNWPGEGFGLRIKSLGLPHPEQIWASVRMEYKAPAEDEEISKEIVYHPTWADWAFTLKNWQGEFKVQESEENCLPLSAFLELNAADRRLYIPVIFRLDPQEKLVRYAVSDEVVNATAAIKRNFSLLRETAGLFTAYPEKLKSLVNEELRQNYEQAHITMKKEMEEEKQEWESKHLMEIRAQIKARLMQMSQRPL